MGKVLEMNEYMKGLKAELDRYGIREMYSRDVFTGDRAGCGLFYVDSSIKVRGKLTDYMNPYVADDIGALPDMYFLVLRLDDQARLNSHCIYRDGVFYE